MRLTGVPLLAFAACVTVAIGATTVWLWPRGGRLRPLTRTVSVLLLETLVVTTAGLALNRIEEFYPTWQALAGDTGTRTVTHAVAAGRLDSEVQHGASVLIWRPAGAAAWRLAGPPRVDIPADYRTQAGVTFPVVLDLSGVTAAKQTAQAVTVVVVPTAATTAAALLTLPGELRRDLRVSAEGWDVEGTGALAAAFLRAAPAGLARRYENTGQLPPALAAPMRLPAS